MGPSAAMRSGSGLFYGAPLPQRFGSGARHFILPAATLHALEQAKGAAAAASIFADVLAFHRR